MIASNTDATTQAAIVDCHVHVFEDPNRYPLQVASAYQPPLSPVSTLLDTAHAAGVTRLVLVQPTPYGDDLSLLTQSLADLGRQARGVGVVKAAASEAELARARAAGIVALRFVGMKQADGSDLPGCTSIDALTMHLAPRLRALGMHAQLWAPLPEILARWTALERTGIPIVLDHMGGFDPTLGRGHKDFQRLLALLRDGAVWVKLAICRRVNGLNYDSLRPFHDDLIEANSARLLWASDFPFVRYPGTQPTMSALLGQFRQWVTDKDVARRILIHNPAQLYQFDALSNNNDTGDQG